MISNHGYFNLAGKIILNAKSIINKFSVGQMHQVVYSRYRSKSVLNDDPSSNGLGWRPLQIGTASGLFTGFVARSLFVGASHFHKLKILHRLPANPASLLAAGATFGLGFMYGINRECTKILQPNRPQIPLLIQKAISEPLYSKASNPIEMEDPRIQTIYRLVINNILQQEVNENFFSLFFVCVLLIVSSF